MKKTLLILALMIGSNAMAYDVASTSHKPRAQKTSKADYIRNEGMKCGLAEMDAYEKVKGRLPTDDEMDAILDACVNPTFKKES